MSMSRYPEYKDSGVAWLGDVPSHWGVKQGRRLYLQKRDSALPGDEQLSATQKYGVVPQRLFMEMEDQKVTLALSGLDNFKHVEVDDFVISLRSFQGGIERSKYSGCVSPAYTVLRPAIPVDACYMGYVLKSSGYIAALQSVTDGIRDGKNISYEQFGQIGVPCPSHVEQTAIAAFLDRETAKIDALVAEQEKLIALLKEKRQAVISHAVTKGLDPGVPMKDSGIEWLGEVPAHWEVMALARVTLEKCDGPFGSGIKSDHYTEAGALVVRLQNIRSAGFFHGEPAYLDLEYFETQLFRHNVVPGDLLIAGLGDEINLVGRACVAQEGISPALVKADCFRFRLDQESARPEFIATQLSAGASFDAGRLSSGSTRSRIPLSVMATRKVALPPLAEQAAVVAYLNRETTNFDALISEAERGIGLLRERRSALISAAVTGKIDVRGAATLEEAA